MLQLVEIFEVMKSTLNYFYAIRIVGKIIENCISNKRANFPPKKELSFTVTPLNNTTVLRFACCECNKMRERKMNCDRN